MQQTSLNLSLAVLIAAVLAAGTMLDAPSDNSTEHAQAASLQDAINADTRAQRIAKVAAFKCGPNAGFLEKADGLLACTTHKGKPTGVVFQVAALP